MYLNYYCKTQKVKLEERSIPNADHCAKIVFEASYQWRQTSRDLSFRFSTALNIEVEQFKRCHNPRSMSHDDAIKLVFGNSDLVEEILELYGLTYNENDDIKGELDDLVEWLSNDEAPENKVISLSDIIDSNMARVAQKTSFPII